MASDVFDRFTNKYPLSKTLRFELKPVGKTLKNMRDQLGYDENLQTFLKDQHIEDAYQTLKPYMDKLHEEFINLSLNTSHAKEAPFHEYISAKIELLKHKEQLKKTGKSKQEAASDKTASELEKNLDVLGNKLRLSLSAAFQEAGELWKQKYNKQEWKKGSGAANSFRVLSSPDVLNLIQDLISSCEDPAEKQRVQSALKEFRGFFTYFSGFIQNRENYYETKKEAVTAVATRTVHENLPRFADNVAAFVSRKDEYLRAYSFLRSMNKTLVTKDGETLLPIQEELFSYQHFNECLSQSQIEQYNAAIGNANFISNLYNQAKRSEPGFRRLPKFKTLYKQIGCGKKGALFAELTHERKSNAEEARQKDQNRQFFSVEEVLTLAKAAGERYFDKGSATATESTNTVPNLLEYITSRETYEGLYWSKVALNTVSGKYFANWHDLKDKLKDAKVFKKGSKDNAEDIKIPEVIELEGFFEVLNESADWQTSLFKKGLLLDEAKREIIETAHNPANALLRMISHDIAYHAKSFLDDSATVERITREYFALSDSDKAKEQKKKEWKEAIKAWMDHALAVNRMIKYFKVQENKVKGTPIDATLSDTLDALLCAEDAEWLKWYNDLRNFLTKKPQDDAKTNKLKLNFENGSLLGGWSDGQEKSKAAVLLRKDGLYYLGILKKKSIFDTSKANNDIYKSTADNAGRLILANLKFQTLAGKGFLGKFGESYSSMGKADPNKAILSLQTIIRERYADRYPRLKALSERKYSDKKKFYKDIQEALKESYVCEFRDIDWQKVEQHTESGDIYLFQIYSKDFAAGKSGRKDLQTMYWESLFTGNAAHQLNGGGEVFYRKQALKKRNVKPGFEDKPWVIENKRFTEEQGKFSFHCPIKLNYKSTEQRKPEYAFPHVNKYVNEHLVANANLFFLGIDRGEKHFAYYSLTDEQGKIHKSGTLNMPFKDKDGNPRTVVAKKRLLDKDGNEQEIEVACKDYNDLLEARAGDRNYARKNWQTIGTIKELKEGYISQVVHEIAALATDQPTFIVLEDLSVGFMRGRQKIDKSVYKKLEVALLKKLNFLVDKTKDGKHDELGSVNKALQLTPPASNYDELKERGKQAGIMLFVRPNFTSQTDPVTGWRKKIYINSGSESDIRSRIIASFDDIYFDGHDYVFTYKDSVTGKLWKMYSGKNGKGLDRFYRERNDHGAWVEVAQDLPKMLDGLFADFDKNTSLLDQLKRSQNPQKINKHTAWESLRFAINLIQQIRNSGKEGDERNADFILSPVRNEQGEHFDSRIYWDKQQAGQSIDLPSSGDANGAYNIARKGIILNEHLKKGLKLYVGDEEWDAWLAGKDVWEKWLVQNSSRLKK